MTRPYLFPYNPRTGVLFTGSNSGNITTASDASINNFTKCTIVVLIKALGFGQSNLGRIQEKNGIKRIIFNGIGGNNYIQFQHQFAPTAGDWRTPIKSVVLSSVQQFAVTYDNTNVANDPIFYINGSLVTTTEVTAPIGAASNDAGSLIIGNRAALDRTAYMNLYEYLYFNDILTESDVNNLYHGNIAPTAYSSLRIWHDYRLGHSTDLSGYNNNGISSNVLFSSS